MKIPKTLRIGAVLWTVQQVPPDEFDGGSACGDTNRALALIRINHDLPEDMKEQTFMHELLHAIDFQLDHDVVELMAALLHQVFSANGICFDPPKKV